ncbi:hypothetical protein NDU88_010840, partial [Pleurodeles waltl]
SSRQFPNGKGKVPSVLAHHVHTSVEVLHAGMVVSHKAVQHTTNSAQNSVLQ